jgi:hypothetical protein
LIIAGATALVGGAMLVGLAAALSQLAVIAEVLKGKPARAADVNQIADVKRIAEVPPSEPRVPEPPPAEVPPPATIEVSASAIERLRATMVRTDRVVTNGEDVPLSPNGGAAHPEAEAKREPMKRATVEAVKEPPRLDFLLRPRTPRPPQSESFDAMWPKRTTRGASDQSKAEEVARQPGPPPPSEDRRAPPPPAPTQEPRSVPILKSGVVDGMAYTLYADGSIEAQLPHGTVRFGSIAELRAHIENGT